MTALSDPRLSSTSIILRTVSHILINVPLTLALAIMDPWKVIGVTLGLWWRSLIQYSRTYEICQYPTCWLIAIQHSSFWWAFIVTGAEDTCCSVVDMFTICKLPILYPGKTINSPPSILPPAWLSLIGLISHRPRGLSFVVRVYSFWQRFGNEKTCIWFLEKYMILLCAQKSVTQLYGMRRSFFRVINRCLPAHSNKSISFQSDG